MKALRILIADDHAVVREAARALIGTNRQWRVCGEAACGRDAIARARTLRPDIIVMDLCKSPVGGLEATREIVSFDPRIRVLILTMHESEQMIREVLEAGAHGYVLKSDVDHGLIAGLRALANGKTFFASKVGRRVSKAYLHERIHDSRAA